MIEHRTTTPWLRNHRGQTIDRMSWQEFERCVKEVFRFGGWAVQSTTYYDLGSDTLAVLDGMEYAIQTKHRSDPEAGINLEAVEQAARGRARYQSSRALLVTNAVMTAAAERSATELAVVLWDRYALAARMHRLGLLALDADSFMACPSCGLGMVIADFRARAVWMCDSRTSGCGTRLPYCAPVLRLI